MTPLSQVLFSREINPETKSVTYWAKHLAADPTWVTFEDIAAFEREMTALNCNGRICVHAGPDALLHDMIIFEKTNHVFPAHRHPTKAETILALTNNLTITILRSRDSKSTYTLRPESTIVIPPGVYHQIKTHPPYSIYRETKLGPFLGPADREFLR